LRDRLLGEIAVTRREAGAAGIYATHDTAEALAIADRVLLLRDGAVVQAGTPTDVYEAPVDAWAARLTGPASEIEARIVTAAGDLVELDVAGVPIRARVDGGGNPCETVAGPVRLLVRPDWAAIGGPLRGSVSAIRFRGSHTDIDLRTPAGPITIRQPGPPSLAVGDVTGWSLRRGRHV
nr:TOBE domain-containing protein [Chloroflexota bacterium]